MLSRTAVGLARGPRAERVPPPGRPRSATVTGKKLIRGDVDGDETGFRFDRHLFQPGEYVSIKEHDDKVRTFRVVSVSDLD
jgi:hypothetical protein